MKTYYQIECWSSLFKKWVRHDFKKYKTLQTAQQIVISYKQNKLGVKFQILKIEKVK
jgi:hypothetical protein